MVALISGIFTGFITVIGGAILLNYSDIDTELQRKEILIKYNK